MLPSKVYLIDRSQLLVDCWKAQFAGRPAVEVLAGDNFQRPGDAIVSPANSFGIMDGGLDLAIRDQLGLAVERKVRAYAPPILQDTVAPQDFFKNTWVQGGGEALLGDAVLGRVGLQE